MRSYPLFIFCISLVILSCSKNDDEGQIRSISEQPQIPESVTYDLNEDAVDDFMIVYSEGIWDGVGASGGFFSAYFRPFGENRILEEYEENVSVTVLFAEMGDTIKRDAIAPQFWSYFGSLTTLYQGGDGVWQEEWLIDSKNPSGPYYLGVGIWENGGFLIGWLKLEIDKKTGKIEIIDHELTSDDYIVIDR